MLKKLRSQMGESMVEVLLAILICAISTAILFQGIAVVTRIMADSSPKNTVFSTDGQTGERVTVTVTPSTRSDSDKAVAAAMDKFTTNNKYVWYGIP